MATHNAAADLPEDLDPALREEILTARAERANAEQMTVELRRQKTEDWMPMWSRIRVAALNGSLDDRFGTEVEAAMTRRAG